MAKHRTYSIEFKRQVAQEFLAGESLHGLAPARTRSVDNGVKRETTAAKNRFEISAYLISAQALEAIPRKRTEPT